MLNLSKTVIARTLFFAAIIALGVQGQPTARSSASTVISPGSSVILCQPGFVYRCTPLGCFCVKL